MPARFTLKEADLRAVLAELKQLDPNLQKELRKELRSQLKPVADDLKGGIPKEAPLSGFGRGKGSPPYIFGTVSSSVRTSFRGRRGRAFNNVASIQLADRRPNAGFSILELAGSKNPNGVTPQGRALIRNLAGKGFGIKGGLGRFAIPEFKNKQGDVEKIAVDILERFASMVNRRLRRR